jgi:hypothetical protein
MNANMVYALIGMIGQIKENDVANWAPSTLGRVQFFLDQLAAMIEKEQTRRWQIEQARIKREIQALESDMDVGAHDCIRARRGLPESTIDEIG